MDNIVPAIIDKTNEISLNQLSPQEFQRLLNGWFQEKGIVQDMKSYLKFQMISVLKDTEIGENIKKNPYRTYTLAQQALHLIVAEYLLYCECHFTLSLFISEMNLSNKLPQLKAFSEKNSFFKIVTSRFDKENVVNILELLGVAKDSVYYSNILDTYFNKKGSSLLSCLLNVISNNCRSDMNQDHKPDDKTDEESEDDFTKNIRLVVQSLNLPLTMQTQLLHNLNICYNLKTKSYENQVVQLVGKFKKELYAQDKKLQHATKRKRCLEKRLLKLKEENHSLKARMVTEDKAVVTTCSLCHCTEDCVTTKRLCEAYAKEIDRLKEINKRQKDEIERLSTNCTQLLKEFDNCQNKIQLASVRLQGVYEEEDDLKDNLKNDLSLSSDSITEDIVEEARQRLKVLEEESEQLDIRFSSFVIK